MSSFYNEGIHSGDDNDTPIYDNISDLGTDFKNHNDNSFNYSSNNRFDDTIRDRESIFETFVPDNVRNMDDSRENFAAVTENNVFFAKRIGQRWLFNMKYDKGWHAFVIYRSFLWFEPRKSSNLKTCYDDLIKAINQGTIDSKTVGNVLLDPTTSVEKSAKDNCIVIVSNGTDSVEIKFANSDAAESWSRGLKFASTDNFFTGVSTQSFRDKLNLLVLGYLYKSGSRNDVMNRFCLNLRDESGSSGSRIVLTSAYNFLKLVVDKSELDLDDVYAFANLLVAVSTNLYLRVLIILVNVVPGMINNFVKPSGLVIQGDIAHKFTISRSTKDGINRDIDYFVNYLIHRTNELSQPPTHLDFEVLLRIVQHPSRLMDDQLNSRNDNKEVSKLELQWISNIRSRLKIFIVENYDIFDFDNMFTSKGLSLLFSISDQVLCELNSNDNVVQYLIANLRKDYAHAQFVARIDPKYYTDAVEKVGPDMKKHYFLPTRHFLSLLFRVKVAHSPTHPLTHSLTNLLTFLLTYTLTHSHSHTYSLA